MDLTQLKWIDEQQENLTDLLVRWAEINSGSYNVQGLARMADAVAREFAVLGEEQRIVELPEAESIDSRGRCVTFPLGKAIVQSKRASNAALRALLVIHYDTVYPADSTFQKTSRVDEQTLRGPGVVDAKGGLLVMLTALKAIERSSWAGKIAWEVIINPDEEIGSPGSVGLLKEAAGRNQVGLVFEPASVEGFMVGARKGSGNFTVVVRGKAAHAGKAFGDGRNAINAASDFVHQIEAKANLGADVTINCGQIEGGGAVNVVPELAIARFNVRVGQVEEQRRVEKLFADVAMEVGRRDGIKVQVHGAFHAPPMILDARREQLIELVQECGSELGLNLGWRPSGGVSDGNKLAAAGLAVVDSLGPRGGNLHSNQEFVILPSLVERAKLTTLLLMKLADTVPTWL